MSFSTFRTSLHTFEESFMCPYILSHFLVKSSSVPVLVLRTHTPVAAVELCRVNLVLAASLIIALLLWYPSSGGLLSLVVVPCFFSS